MDRNKAGVTDSILSSVGEYFRGRRDIHTVIVYGSAAEAAGGDGIRFTAESDVDVAVAGAAELGPEERLEIYEALTKKLRRDVDVRDLSTLHGIILSQVLLNGVILKKEDPAYFEARLREMIYFRQDMLPIILEGMEYRLREFADGR